MKMKNIKEVLTEEEVEFIERVHYNEGGKIHDIWSSENGEPLWYKPEELGIVECVGSYKWVLKNLKIEFFMEDR